MWGDKKQAQTDSRFVISESNHIVKSERGQSWHVAQVSEASQRNMRLLEKQVSIDKRRW